MANLNLLLLGVLLVAAGGSIGFVILLVLQQEITVHRRPRVIQTIIIGFIAVCVLRDGGISGLAVCLAGAICFFFLGLVLRNVLFGADVPLPPIRPPQPRRPTQWRVDGRKLAEFVAFLLLLAIMVLALRQNQTVHLQSQQTGPPNLDLIEDIESDID